VCDTFSPHRKAEVADWCSPNDVKFVFNPTNASWRNWIGCEFTALRYFTSTAATRQSRSPATSAGPAKHAKPKGASRPNPRIRS
jgi:hypothetical protein